MKKKSFTCGLAALLLIAAAATAQPTGAQPPATVTVTSPNGGEIWENGSTQTIQWKYAGVEPARMYRVLLSTDGGKTFPIVLAEDLPPTMTEFRWLVRSPDTDMAMVRVSALLPVDNPLLPALQSVDDNSDAPFSIVTKLPPPIIQPPMLSVVSPNGGEIWQMGTPQTIVWKYAGDAKVEYFTVGISSDGGRNYTMIAEKLPPQNLAFKWEIPKSDVGKENLIKVTARLSDPTGAVGFVEDVSDRPFAIAAPIGMPEPIITGNVVVVSPNGKEQWHEGQPVKIKWQMEGPMPVSYSVLLSLDGGMTYPITIGANIPGNMTELGWTVKVDARAPVKNAMLKIVAMYPQQQVEDVSDGFFLITPSNRPDMPEGAQPVQR